MGRPRGGGGGGGKGKGPPGANLFIACKGGTFQGLSDESLHMAFARFGEIVRCEVTIDRNTGELRDSRCVPSEMRPVSHHPPLLPAPPRPSRVPPHPAPPATGMAKGFAFVSFTTPDAANMAMNQMQGQLIEGRQIRVEVSNT